MKHRFLFLYLAFVVSLVILVVLSFLFTQQFGSLIKYNRSVDDTYKVLYRVQILDSHVKEMESGVRGYIITADSFYLRPFIIHRLHLTAEMDSLQELISQNDKQRNKLAMIRSTIRFRLDILQRIIQKVAVSDTSGLSENLHNSNYLLETLQQQIIELENGELFALDEHTKNKKLYEDITPGYLRTVLLFSIFIAITSFFFLNNELRRRLGYQKQLEKKVRELHRSNYELEQITHVASHDLLEPLRKMRTFSNRLFVKHAENVSEEIKQILTRIDASASRMYELISDLVNFTNLIHSTENITEVNLNQVVEKVIGELRHEISSKKAVITSDPLPVIQGYPDQLFLLFKSLLDNSLKFSRDDVVPSFSIRRCPDDKERLLYHVMIEDNGIGFNNEFAKKIFILFQRLHAQHSHYKGKGIGLTIVQRVMVNHNGTVTAEGTEGKGAIFNLYFPIPSD